ncbi:heparinase II/III domain-containing protein [Metabacillus arenae]|uniref:Heparinase II/III family protein n=1 Tax=Metabacillus arenae TaxID=2771434 RepID=A0A926RYB4_9BACI|nr:heparinase II/III family protein [Metabacillus arenae]MBD1381017.1 heparinase II/III family protein [Metabacillus arenae]
MQREKILLLFVLLWCIGLFFPKDLIAMKKSTTNGPLMISDFEQEDTWKGLKPEEGLVKEGSKAGRWEIYNDTTGSYLKTVFTEDFEHNWSNHDALTFWAHSAKATGSKIYLILYSDNEQTVGLDYYSTTMIADWEGWKKVTIPFDTFKTSRTPAGFGKIDMIKFHTSWQGETPDPETELIFDSMEISKLADLGLLPVDGFEDISKWTSLTADTTHVKEGAKSGKWSELDKKTVVQSRTIPKDWSHHDYLEFWLYSEKATGTDIYTILGSDNPETTNYDYYLASINVDWSGWKQVKLYKDDFSPSYQPLGFDQIDLLKFHSKWFATANPDPETVVYFDAMKLVKEPLYINPAVIHKQAAVQMDTLNYVTSFTNQTTKPGTFKFDIPEELSGKVTVSPIEGTLQPGEKKEISFSVNIEADEQPGTKKEINIPINTELTLNKEPSMTLSYEIVQWNKSSHENPNSLVSKDELTRAKERIQSEEWAKTYYEKLIQKADQYVLKNTTVPDLPGGHGMWFRCGDHEQLEYNPDSPNRHYCPSEDKYYTGYSYDAGWRYYRHNDIIEGLRDTATAYALSGEERYAEKIKAVLLDYANIYPNYKLQARKGKLHWQSLDESVSMVELANAYDLILDSGLLTDTEQAKIELNLLRLSANTLSNADNTKSNWQAWHDAAIGMVGATLGDKNFLEKAINGDRGFNYLMNNGVLSDGFWWEGSIAYHMYTLRALNFLAEAGGNWGYDLYSHPNLKKMFTTPLQYAYPNLTLPHNNDGGRYGNSLIDLVEENGNHEFEGAYSVYQESSLAAILSKKYELNPREGRFALFHGIDRIPETPLPTIAGQNFEGIGQTILRQGEAADQTFAMMDYGPYGGSHGHPDKLHLDLFGEGEMLAPDFGTPTYIHNLFREWYKQTISHNTVTVDGTSQEQVEGELQLSFHEPGFGFMKAGVPEAYPGVTYERAVLADQNYIVDWFHAGDSTKVHQYDLSLHGLGEYTTNLSLSPRQQPVGTENGYQHIAEPKSAVTSEIWEGTWMKESGKGLHMISMPTGESEVIVGNGPGPSTEPNVKIPMVIQRISGNEANFATVLQPLKSGENPIQATKLNENEMQIHLPDRTDHIYYNREAQNGEVLISRTTTEDGNFKFDQLSITKKNKKVQIKAKAKVKSIELVIKAEDIEEYQIEGKKVKVKASNGYIYINWTKGEK